MNRIFRILTLRLAFVFAFAFTLTLTLPLTLLSVQATAQTQPTSSASSENKSKTGDIDMNQFNNIKQKSGKPKLKVNYSCQDLTGKTYKKDDPGFDKCLDDSQTAIMNKNRPVEAPNGERTH